MRSASTIIFLFAISLSAASAQTPTPEQIFKQFRPVHSVEFDTPPEAEWSKCRVEVERGDNGAGFVVYSPSGEVLRRFTDTDGNNKADLFRFYRMGLEVYRDIDSDKNETPDQHRWMNWGGMRWGIDSDEDRRIDEWKTLSAQEAAQIAVEAMIAGDASMLKSVLLTPGDIRKIKASGMVAEQLTNASADVSKQLRTILSQTQTIKANTKWVRFDPTVPSLIPKEDGKAGVDLVVYENAMAIVENGESHELVSIGEMIKVGEVWKLVAVPSPLDGNDAQISVGGILMQPGISGGGDSGVPEMNEAMTKLIAQLQELDARMPQGNVTPKASAGYNQQRADLVEKLIKVVDADSKEQWTQQLADSLAAATQTGEYDAGLTRLRALEKQTKGSNELNGYVWYRRTLAEYAVRLKEADPDKRQSVQVWWLEQLKTFAQTWPKAVDASDAIVQLAITLELSGRVDDAKRWYEQVAKDHPQSPGGIRAAGALNRLNMVGRSLQLKGRSFTGGELDIAEYRGKTTLVVFWATWAGPYVADLPTLTAVHKKYQAKGFEIIGVNLDTNVDDIRKFVAANGNLWKNIHEPKGTEGPLFQQFGIVSVPTMFMVDKGGKVVTPVTAANLETVVERMLQGKSLNGAARPAANAGLQRN